MSTPADLAALRLELSPGELVCPKKGQMARGRCIQLQQEMACTCAVAAAAGCAIADGWKPPEPEPPTQSELARREAIRAGLLRRRAATTAPTTTARPAPPAKETEMPNTEKMLEAMRAEPDREWTRAELAELRGTELVPTGTALGKLKREGTIESAGRGLYRWAGGEQEAPKAKKAKPAKKSTPKRARPEPEAVSEEVDEPPAEEEGEVDQEQVGGEEEEEEEEEEPGPELGPPARPRAEPTDLMEEATCRMDEAQRLIGLVLSELALGRSAIRRLPYRVSSETREGIGAAAMYLDSAAGALRSSLLGLIGSQVR